MPETADRLRLLVLTDEMEVGGTQRQITQMLLGLDRARFDPTLVYFRHDSFFVDQLEAQGIRVVRIDKRRRVDLAFVQRLRDFVADGRFDVMHCFSITAELWGALAHALTPPTRRPALLSSIRNTYDWEHPLRRRLKAWALRRSWRVAANSRAGADSARQAMGLAAERLRVIYNGVSPRSEPSARDDALRAELGLRPDTPTLLFVGRLVEHKDVATLLRAAARVAAPLRLLLAGDGPLRAGLLEQAGRLGLLERVAFLGQRDDVPALMRVCDAVVLPSVSEGLSNVVIEAMMHGRPVIASRVGGNLELVEHDRTGLLFDAGDDAQLAGCIDRLMRDAPWRERLGRAAADDAMRRFSVRAMVDAYASLYLEASARGRGPAGRSFSQPPSHRLS